MPINPFLAHRRGFQVSSRAHIHVPRRWAKNAMHYHGLHGGPAADPLRIYADRFSGHYGMAALFSPLLRFVSAFMQLDAKGNSLRWIA
jgi:hypothetical protein